MVGENTHELGIYLGAVPLALAVWHLTQQGNRRRFRFATAAGVAAAAFGLLWSCGSFGPLGWLQAHTPLVNKFRLPCRAIVIFQLGTAILAALGFADLVSRQSMECVAGKTIQSRRMWLLPIVALAMAIAAPIVWPAHVSVWPLVIVGPMLLLVSTCLIQFASRGARWALPLLVIFAAADLASYGMSESIWQRTQPLAEFIKQIDIPPAGPQCRVAADLACDQESAPGENGLRRRRSNFINPLETRRWLRRLGAGPAARLSAISRVVGSRRRLDFRSSRGCDFDRICNRKWRPPPKRRATGFLCLIRLPEYAWFPRRFLAAIRPTISAKSPRIKPLSTNRWNCLLAPWERQLLVVDRPGHIVVESNCPAQRLLVVNESYYPGWKATTDGHDAKLLRVNGDFLGVVAPPGRHEICLDFQPESLRIGRLVSGFGLGLLVVTFVLGATLFRPTHAIRGSNANPRLTHTAWQLE